MMLSTMLIRNNLLLTSSLSSSLPESNGSSSLLLTASCCSFAWGWSLIFNLTSFIFLLATGYVSLCSLLIEFPAAPLTLCPIIVLINWRLSHRTTSTAFTPFTIIFRTPSCSHCLPKHLTLCFPLGSFTLLLNWLLILAHHSPLFFIITTNWLLLLTWQWFIRVIIFLGLVFDLSLLFSIEYFTLLNEHFLAHFLMLLQGLLVKFPTACRTFYTFSHVFIFIRCPTTIITIIVRVFRWGKIVFISLFIIFNRPIFIFIIVIVRRFKPTTPLLITV